MPRIVLVIIPVKNELVALVRFVRHTLFENHDSTVGSGQYWHIPQHQGCYFISSVRRPIPCNEYACHPDVAATNGEHVECQQRFYPEQQAHHLIYAVLLTQMEKIYVIQVGRNKWETWNKKMHLFMFSDMPIITAGWSSHRWCLIRSNAISFSSITSTRSYFQSMPNYYTKKFLNSTWVIWSRLNRSVTDFCTPITGDSLQICDVYQTNAEWLIVP